MNVVVNDLAKQSLIDINYYNYQYSLRNAIETNRNILFRIHDLKIRHILADIFQKCRTSVLEKLYTKVHDILDIELCIIYQKILIQFIFLIFLIVNKILIVS